MTEPLFDGPEPLPPPPPTTPGQRRRARQQAAIDLGVHPLSGLTLADNGETCGSCTHRILVGGHARDYPKCDIISLSNSEASDCRARWPACRRWEPRQAAT